MCVGGRLGNMSINVSVLIIMFFDYIRQTRIKYTPGLYDAENYYDGVEHNFDSLTDQAFDITLPEIIFCLKEIQEMKFYLRTVFGDTEGS